MHKSAKFIFSLGFFFLISFTFLSQVSAMTCEEATPRFTGFKDAEAQCIKPYNECVEDPYDYTLGDCGGICNDQYPNRINYIEGANCIGVEHQWIVDAYSNEFSPASAENLANYCDCINTCVDKTKIEYNIEERCTPKLEQCCERVSSGLNPDYDYNQDNEDDEEEKGYFTLSKIEGEGDVEVIRYGTGDEVAISTGGKINEGDTLLVGYKTSAWLTRDDGYYLHIDSMSVLLITKAYFQESLAEVQINLQVGSMTSKIQPAKGLRAKFEIKTPTSTIGVRGTIFTVEYDDETGVTKAYAHQHDIYLEDDIDGNTYEVAEGEYINYEFYDTDPDISSIPSDKKLANDFFDGYGTTFEDGETDDTDSASSTGLILVTLCCFGVLIIGSTGFLLISLKKKKKSLVIISIVLIGTLGICGMLSVGVILLTDSSDDNETNTTETEQIETAETEENSDSYSSDSEIETETVTLLENIDEKFSFSAGDITEELAEIGPNEGYYAYCYPTDSGLGSSYSVCGEGGVEIFSIREVGEVLYEEEYVLTEPLVNYELLGTNDYGYYYILELPNGEMPEELQPVTQYTDEVVESFEVR